MTTAKATTCYVDLPNPHDLDGPWISVFIGEKEAAIAFVKKKFGADDKGNIQLITEDEDEMS